MKISTPHMAVALLTLCFAHTAVYGEIPDELQTAFRAMPEFDISQWYFRETVSNGESVRIREHNPALETPWQLISIDGRAPNDKELEKHAKRLTKEAEDNRDNPGENDFFNLAADNSWELIIEHPTLATYRFSPSTDDDEFAAITENIRGELTLDRQHGRVQSFRLFSIKPFRAKLIAKISEFETLIEMSEIAPGEYFATRIKSKIRGRAFGLKKIDSDSLVSYSDFERLAAAPNSIDSLSGGSIPAAPPHQQ